MLICTYPGRFLQVVSLENKNNRICKQNTTRHTQNRTNTQQQNELRRPTLQQLCPFLHGQGSGGIMSWHRSSPWVHCRGTASGLLSPLLVPLFGPTNSTRQKLSDGRGVDLMWPLFYDLTPQSTQQSADTMVARRQRVFWTIESNGRKMMTIKYTLALNGLW